MKRATHLVPHRAMFTGGLEQEGRQIDGEELLQFLLIVADTQDAEVDLFDEVELSLLGCHDGWW